MLEYIVDESLVRDRFSTDLLRYARFESDFDSISGKIVGVREASMLEEKQRVIEFGLSDSLQDCSSHPEGHWISLRRLQSHRRTRRKSSTSARVDHACLGDRDATP